MPDIQALLHCATACQAHTDGISDLLFLYRRCALDALIGKPYLIYGCFTTLKTKKISLIVERLERLPEN